VHDAPRRQQMEISAYEFYMDEEINEQIQTMLREEE
jgi:hypothetical protein